MLIQQEFYEKLVLDCFISTNESLPDLARAMLELAEESLEHLNANSDAEKLDELGDMYFWYTWLKITQLPEDLPACSTDDIDLKIAVQNLLGMTKRYYRDGRIFSLEYAQKLILELGYAIELEAKLLHVSKEKLRYGNAIKLLRRRMNNTIRGEGER